MVPEITDLSREKYQSQTAETLSPVDERTISIKLIVFYPGNKKNAYASRYIIESFYDLFKNSLLEYELDSNLSNIKLSKVKSRWYKLVGEVTLKSHPEMEKEDLYTCLSECITKTHSSKECFSAIFFDFGFEDYSIEEPLVSLEKKHQSINSSFKNEFYLFEYLDKQFHCLKRFNKVDEFTFSLFSPLGGSKRVKLSLNYIKIDRLLKIRWEIGNEILEEQLDVPKQFSFSDCFQPRTFISIISLLNRLEKHKLHAHVLTAYTFNYTRFFGKYRKFSYSGEIKSCERAFFLQLADLALFSLPVLQSLDQITRELEYYYSSNKREISKRYLKGKRSLKKDTSLKSEKNKDLSPFLA